MPPGRQLPPGMVPPELLQEWAASFHHGMNPPPPAPGLGPPDLANVVPWPHNTPLGPGAGYADAASLDRSQLLIARQNAQESETGASRQKVAEKGGAGLKAKAANDLPPLYDLVSPPNTDGAAAIGAGGRATSSRTGGGMQAAGHHASAPQLHQSNSQTTNEAGSLLLQMVKESEQPRASKDGITKGAELLAKLKPPAKEDSKVQAEGQALLGLLRGAVPTPNNKSSGASARGAGKKGAGDGAALLRKLQPQASKQEAAATTWKPQGSQQDGWWEGHDAWQKGWAEQQSGRKWRSGKDSDKWHSSS